MHKITGKIYWFLFTVLMVASSSCTSILYAPTGQNVPLLKEKDEMRVNAELALSEELIGGDVQLAYAISENFGLSGSGTFLTSGNSNWWQGYGYQTEMAGGFFRPLGKWGVAEIYGGTGFAKITQGPPVMKFSLFYLKPFIQPAIGFNSSLFEIALSSKIAAVCYKDPLILDYELMTDSNGNPVMDQNGNFTFRSLDEQRTFFALEPAITARAGWKYVKVQLQGVLSLNRIPSANYLSLTLGLSANLAPRFNKAIP